MWEKYVEVSSNCISKVSSSSVSKGLKHDWVLSRQSQALECSARLCSLEKVVDGARHNCVMWIHAHACACTRVSGSSVIKDLWLTVNHGRCRTALRTCLEFVILRFFLTHNGMLSSRFQEVRCEVFDQMKDGICELARTDLPRRWHTVWSGKHVHGGWCAASMKPQDVPFVAEDS